VSSTSHQIKAASLPETSGLQLSFPCSYRFDVPTQMEDSNDTRPMDWSSDSSAGAEPTLGGDMTGNQAPDEVAGEPAARDAQPRVPGKWRSNIWNHFEKLPGHEEHRKVKCRHCDKVYVCNGSSTVERHCQA
jgi:hypothetical protein